MNLDQYDNNAEKIGALAMQTYDEIAGFLDTLPEPIPMPTMMQVSIDDALTAMIEARRKLSSEKVSEDARSAALMAILTWVSGVNLVMIQRAPDGSDNYLLEAAAFQLLETAHHAQKVHRLLTAH
ncbi:hypothetical protein [Nocardia iowensis]|uniref:Uncharacterized protein n=1 Tax=Nocardia iowensis TaxID=204891 RepID=A0ABX8RUD9_NOCIO|nr:hypothetical protein [Nocardia iowensis]QXN91955.1 hypothetical protein KV110_01820 [Nocardia iowensis]